MSNYKAYASAEQHFNPRSPHGERRGDHGNRPLRGRFQPTLPARGATCRLDEIESVSRLFQPTLPARGATEFANAPVSAPLFQPTLPARGATRTATGGTPNRLNFNPRSPHGERHLQQQRGRSLHQHFNPRSPHGERRAARVELDRRNGRFQPTLPARGATNRYKESAIRQWLFQPTLPARGATRAPRHSPPAA